MMRMARLSRLMQAPPASVYGKRRIARAEPVILALRLPDGGDGQALQVAHGPLPFSIWQGQDAFVTSLRTFWATQTFRPRARGAQGTTWVELWIAYEMAFGSCPRTNRAREVDGLLGPRPHARVMLANFTAASRWLLLPCLIVHPTLFGGTATRGLALKHLVVSTTTATLDACFCGDPDVYKGVQLRVLALRGVTAASAQACRDGRPISLRKRPLSMTTPVP